MDNITQKEGKKLEEINIDLMMQSVATSYMTLVGRCFDHCINDFTSKSLSGKEEGCIKKCSEKFMKFSQRMDQRFNEEGANLKP
ncbi:Tim10/DDP family zinc finger-domain-containing protein [Lipomyces japonicus]|uniref:Tim10/DDP family zinc finger-domain-containing protein n=1 Tax=Lipomyces japonicus TaxID=56871 RepID=UPI0034CDB421